MVRFVPELRAKFFESARELHKRGLTVDTMLPATCSVFGTFDSKVDAKKVLDGVGEIVEWKLDV
jgi:hypothetical protein